MAKTPFIRLQQNLENLIDIKEDKTIFYGGILGTFDSLGNEIVDVPGRSNFSYVRLNGSLGEVIEAFNITVTADFGLKVKIAKKPGEFFYEVVGLDLAQYSDWGDGGANPFLPKHAFTHSFGAGTDVGNDPVFIYKRQLLQPMGLQPIGTGTAFYGYVNPDFYIWNSNISYFEGQYTASLSGLKPTNAQSRYVTIYLDGNTGALAYKTGSLFTPPSTVAEMIANIPEVGLNEGFQLNAVYLVSGTTSVNWDNTFDVRNFLNAGGSYGIGSVTGVAEGAVLFGSTSGTITWDVNKFKWLDSTDQLLIGTSSLPFATATKETIVMTGTNAAIALIGYGSNGGSLFGRAVNGSQTTPSGTQNNLRLLNLEGSGYENSEGYTTFRARLVAISQNNWVSGSTPAYWEMWATPTGSATAEVVHRWYGMYEDAYKPVHLNYLRFGTGSIYTQFTGPTGSASIIPYKLPEAQGSISTVLTNDGSGNLSWGVGGGGSGSVAVGGYPTGIPEGVVLFGRTGTIGWEETNFYWNRNSDRLIIGTTTVDSFFGTNPGNLYIEATGIAGRIDLVSYNTPYGGKIAGFGIGGAPPLGDTTAAGKKLMSVEAGGHNSVGFVGEKASIDAIAVANWNSGNNPTYWEIRATPTGTSIVAVINRIYGDYEEHYRNVHLADNLIFGTGFINYTSFMKATGQVGNISYILPTTQGAASSYLGNDGSGNLSWAIPSVTGGSSSVGGYPTGVPDNVVLFGRTGTISWENAFKYDRNNDLLSIDSTLNGLAGIYPTTPAFVIGKEGQASEITLVSFEYSSVFRGGRIGGSSSSPASTTRGEMVGIYADGYVSAVGPVTSGAVFAAFAKDDWVENNTPTYWEIKATPTGTSSASIVNRIYGSYEEHYKPLHLDELRFGTGSVYTQFSGPTGSASIISYKLPEAQGASSTFLRNDGSGNLSWNIAGGASDILAGNTTLDFGSFPGKSNATVSVTGQSITATSIITAWISPGTGTIDHTPDEHVVERIKIYARDIVIGTGFTIHGMYEGLDFINQVQLGYQRGQSSTRNLNTPTIYGKWNVSWLSKG